MSVNTLPVFYNMSYTVKDGMLTSEALSYNDQLWQSLNQVVDQANNGVQLPQKTTAEITAYRDDTDIPIGTMWFNTTTAFVEVKTVQAVSPAPGVIKQLDYV